MDEKGKGKMDESESKEVEELVKKMQQQEEEENKASSSQISDSKDGMTPIFDLGDQPADDKAKIQKEEGEEIDGSLNLAKLTPDLTIAIWGINNAMRLCPPIADIRNYRLSNVRWNALAATPYCAAAYVKAAFQSLFVMDRTKTKLYTSHSLLEDFYSNLDRPLIRTFATPPMRPANPAIIEDLKEDELDVFSTRPKVGNTCMGLIALYNECCRDQVMIWNPLTSEYVVAPGTSERCDLEVVVGLGYSKENDQFKVLRISFNRNIVPEQLALIEVHTVGIGGWREIEGGEDFADVLRHPSCVNGSIYFLVASKGAAGQLSLFSFDLNAESLQQVIWPEQQSFYFGKTAIGNINGSLYTIKSEWQDNIIGHGSDLQAWKLNDGVWDVLFNVTIPNDFSARKCPFLFTVPREENSYMIYYDNNNQIFIYSGPGIGLTRFLLEGADDSLKFSLFDYVPNIMHLQHALNLDAANGNDEITVYKSQKGEQELVRLLAWAGEDDDDGADIPIVP